MDIPRGCVAAYYPEASGLVAASTFSSQSRAPLYKEMPVRVVGHVPEGTQIISDI